jgi:hypothetical protein
MPSRRVSPEGVLLRPMRPVNPPTGRDRSTATAAGTTASSGHGDRPAPVALANVESGTSSCSFGGLDATRSWEHTQQRAH